MICRHFAEIARKDFREAYHLFTEKDFCMMFRKADKKQKALYAGLSGQPVTYQHLEEFLISHEGKRSCFRILKNYRSRIL